MPTTFPDGYYVSTGTVLSDTDETVCYTVPTGKWAYVQQVTATDTAGAAGTLTVKAVKAGTTYTLVVAGVIPANDAFDMELKPLHLAAADTIKCTANAATKHVMINALEIAQPGA